MVVMGRQTATAKVRTLATQLNAVRSWQIVKCLSDSAGYLLHVFTSSLFSFQAAKY